MREVEAISLSVSKYKENDGIINLLTKEEIIPILGLGIFKIDNKNHQFTNKFIYGKYEIYKGKVGGEKLKSCKVIEYFPLYFKNLDHLLVADYLSELLLKVSENPETELLFDSLIKCFEEIKNNLTINPFIYYILFIKDFICANGVKPNLNNELVEGYFNFDIGEIGQNATKDTSIHVDQVGIKLLYSLFNNEQDFLSLINHNINYIDLIIKILSYHIESSFNIKLNYLNLL